MQIDNEIIIDYHNIRKGYADFLNDWNWELFCTLSFNHKVDFSTAKKDVKRWLKNHKNVFRKIKYAALLLFSNPRNKTPHVHILMISDPRYPERLTDIYPLLLQFIEYSWIKGTCRIEKVWDSRGISYYVTKMKNITLWDAERWDIDYYRPKLLVRLRRFPCPV